MELWSLMHFLMPNVFESNREFKDWFANPMTSMIEGESSMNEDLVNRLHAILRPFLLRRLKRDVEKQLPQKYEHLVMCPLSKRQRFLYEEFLANSLTRQTLDGGNFLGIVNVLMQLRKVCNHPDLFEVRPIVSSLTMESLVLPLPSMIYNERLLLDRNQFPSSADQLLRSADDDDADGNSRDVSSLLRALPELDIIGNSYDYQLSCVEFDSLQQLKCSPADLMQLNTGNVISASTYAAPAVLSTLKRFNAPLDQLRQSELDQRFSESFLLADRRARGRPLIARDTVETLTIDRRRFPSRFVHTIADDDARSSFEDYSEKHRSMVLLPAQRSEQLQSLVQRFVFVIPRASAPSPQLTCFHPSPLWQAEQDERQDVLGSTVSANDSIFRAASVRTELSFPDKRLVQYDCGKLQQMAVLLRRLKSEGHRVLIFTQMTRMLDILEVFLSFYAYNYVRLDGTTKIERRQQLMERFNRDPRVFAFILSTRSGGVGINLTGADTVIFYDSDWNPSIDAQAQDRCHRIGQTREVHIYRLISEHTIEENILKKANQKRQLENVAITSGGFTTDFFKRVDLRELLNDEDVAAAAAPRTTSTAAAAVSSSSAPTTATTSTKTITEQDWVKAVTSLEEEVDTQALAITEKEVQEELEDFQEDTKLDARAASSSPATAVAMLSKPAPSINEPQSLEDINVDRTDDAPPPQIQLAAATKETDSLQAVLSSVQK
jgi:E1A-binding protein p400